MPYVGGSTRLKLTQGSLQKAQLALPPLPEQRRIVSKIDSLSAKSKRAGDNLDHIPRLVEKYKQAILAASYESKVVRATSAAYQTQPISSMISTLDQGWSPRCEREAARACQSIPGRAYAARPKRWTRERAFGAHSRGAADGFDAIP
jgi:hypothetical protein